MIRVPCPSWLWQACSRRDWDHYRATTPGYAADRLWRVPRAVIRSVSVDSVGFLHAAPAVLELAACEVSLVATPGEGSQIEGRRTWVGLGMPDSDYPGEALALRGARFMGFTPAYGDVVMVTRFFHAETVEVVVYKLWGRS